MTPTHADTVAALAAISLLAIAFGARLGYFRKTRFQTPNVPVSYVFLALGAYIGLTTVAVILGRMTWGPIMQPEGSLVPVEELPGYSTMLMLAQAVALIAMLLLFRIFDRTRVAAIWGSGPVWRAIAVGAASLIIAYPLLGLLNEVSGSFLDRILGPDRPTQVPVDMLNKLRDQPLGYLLNGIVIALIIPMAEEFFFRGLIHNWLRSRMRFSYALILSSLIFGFAHFHSQQGWTNIQIVGTICLLGAFFAYAYERQESLFASIACHSLFNTITTVAVYIKGA